MLHLGQELALRAIGGFRPPRRLRQFSRRLSFPLQHLLQFFLDLLAQEGRDLLAIHARHLDVQENKRELVVDGQSERIVSGIGLEPFGVQPGQDTLYGEQVRRPVVHDQYVRFGLGSLVVHP